MKVAPTKESAEAEEDLVKQLTGEILRLAKERGWKDKDLAAAAKKRSASTFYGWRNKSRKNPSLLDLQAFAQAVGLNVGLVAQGAARTPGNAIQSRGGVGGNLKPETTAVVALMESESTSDELRAAIREEVIRLVTGRASHPLDADAEQAGPRARGSKS